jgi:hypothetical protein
MLVLFPMGKKNARVPQGTPFLKQPPRTPFERTCLPRGPSAGFLGLMGLKDYLASEERWCRL